MKIIREWNNWQLTNEGPNTYFLNRQYDPAWFRALKAKTDEAALIEAAEIACKEEEAPGPPVLWDKQNHTKEQCFIMALRLREELLKNHEELPPFRALVSIVAKVGWMF